MNPSSTPGSRARSPLGGAESWLFALGLGAAAMYFSDPVQGGRRRARARDRLLHLGRLLRTAGEAAARDAAHRIRGWGARGRRVIQRRAVSDQVLTGRVRATLGRFVAHPHALDITVREGRVVLSGPVLAYEEGRLLERVRRVRGVRGVDNRLEVHERPDRISALQGGRTRSGERMEWLQRRWSPSARTAGGALGTVMLCAGARLGGLPGFGLGALGLALLARAAANEELAAVLGLRRGGVVVQKTIHINDTPERVFEFWSQCESFPRFMSRVIEVRPLGANRWRWVVCGPGGIPIEWTAERVRSVPGRLVQWRSCEEGSVVQHAGSVRFDPNRDGGTRVQVRLWYQPPIGVVGHALAKLFGADPKSGLDADLMRMKSMIETGRAPHDAAQRAERGQGAPAEKRAAESDVLPPRGGPGLRAKHFSSGD